MSPSLCHTQALHNITPALREHLRERLWSSIVYGYHSCGVHVYASARKWYSTVGD